MQLVDEKLFLKINAEELEHEASQVAVHAQ